MLRANCCGWRRSRSANILRGKKPRFGRKKHIFDRKSGKSGWGPGRVPRRHPATNHKQKAAKRSSRAPKSFELATKGTRALSTPSVQKIHRPLLAKGITAACFSIARFSLISGHAFQLAGYALFSLESSNRTLISIPRSTYQDSLASQNSLYFQSAFKATKKTKNRLPSL